MSNASKILRGGFGLELLLLFVFKLWNINNIMSLYDADTCLLTLEIFTRSFILHTVNEDSLFLDPNNKESVIVNHYNKDSFIVDHYYRDSLIADHYHEDSLVVDHQHHYLSVFRRQFPMPPKYFVEVLGWRCCYCFF